MDSPLSPEVSGEAHRYQVTVRAADGHELAFTHVNHDDLLHVAARLQAVSKLDSNDAASLAIGLKLLTETVMSLRKVDPYRALWPALAAFTRALKNAAAERPMPSIDSARTDFSPTRSDVTRVRYPAIKA